MNSRQWNKLAQCSTIAAIITMVIALVILFLRGLHSYSYLACWVAYFLFMILQRFASKRSDRENGREWAKIYKALKEEIDAKEAAWQKEMDELDIPPMFKYNDNSQQKNLGN